MKTSVAIMLGALALAAAEAAAAPVAVERVIAVEEAGSPMGRYRIVFVTADLLPQPTDTFGGVGYTLGGEVLRFSPMAPRTLVHHGYFDRLPAGAADLAAVGEEAPGAAMRVDAERMLAVSRPARGGFEGAHIRRSAGDVDLWGAWTGADVVFTGVLLREDNDPADDSVWRLWFRPEEVLRNDAGAALPDLAIVHVRGRHPWNELGGRYVVFAQAGAAGLLAAPGAHTEVRLWWPERDDVLELVRALAALGDGPAQAAVLMEGLASPAAEVRYTAAARLAALAPQLPPDLLRQARDAARAGLGNEPSAAVRRAISSLLAP
jgi:hypothetical protein